MKFRILIFIFGVVSLTAESKELVDKIVASVSSDALLLSEVKSFSSRVDRQGSVDDTLLLGTSLETLRKSKTEQLNYLLREKILDSEIKRLGLSAGDSQVEGELAQMAKRNHLGTAEFSDYLKSQGYSIDEYKQILKSRI
jgi:peptidyl-prolyl cis-trans isomerase SurA